MSRNRGFGLAIRLVVFTLCLYSAQAAATEDAKKTSAPWTLMVYAAIDNGAESEFEAQAGLGERCRLGRNPPAEAEASPSQSRGEHEQHSHGSLRVLTPR